VFAHHPRQEKQDGRKTPKRIPRTPVAAGCSVTANDANTLYSVGAWRLPADGITYYVNLRSIPTNLRPQIQQILRDAAAVWTDTDSRQVFVDGGATNRPAGRFDGVNAIGWGRTSAGAIATTYVWYNDSGEAIEADTVFSNALPWAIFNPSGGECQTSPVAYDAQNIAAHEFGHWVGLLDLYQLAESDLTMYGYSNVGELKKRTLGAGDRLGVAAVGR
jgi:hypothetical protein